MHHILVRVHLWDLSGNEEYLDVRNELYGNSDAVFLVFDVTNSVSFEDLDLWMRELNKYGSGPSPHVVLVGNKVCIIFVNLDKGVGMIFREGSQNKGIEGIKEKMNERSVAA